MRVCRVTRAICGTVLVVCCFLSLISPVVGKFYYPNFNNRQHLSLNGDAEREDECIRLTGGDENREQIGSFFLQEKIDISKGMLTAFSFRMRPATVGPVKKSLKEKMFGGEDSSETTSTEGFQGFAFVLQKVGEKEVGKGGGGMGFSGFHDALVIEFDAFSNTKLNDPDYTHISVHHAVRAPVSALETISKMPVKYVFPKVRSLLYCTADSVAVPFLSFSLALSLSLSLTHSLAHSASPLPFSRRHSHLPPFQQDTDAPISVTITYDGQTVKVFLTEDLSQAVLSSEIGFLEGQFYTGFTASSLPFSMDDRNNNMTSVADICSWYLDLKQPNEKCNRGFQAPSCTVDSKPELKECLHLTSCRPCVTSSRDCRWCASKKRCVAGVSLSAELTQNFCPDKVLVTDEDGSCLFVCLLFPFSFSFSLFFYAVYSLHSLVLIPCLPLSLSLSISLSFFLDVSPLITLLRAPLILTTLPLSLQLSNSMHTRKRLHDVGLDFLLCLLDPGHPRCLPGQALFPPKLIR